MTSEPGVTNNINDVCHPNPHSKARNQDTQSEDLNDAMDEWGSHHTHENGTEWEEKKHRRPH
jgi:hypothetical protein